MRHRAVTHPFAGCTQSMEIAPASRRLKVAFRSLAIQCLDKDARTRLRDIGEARIALVGSNMVDSAAVQTNAGPSPRARSGAAPWAVALLLALAASAVTWWMASRRPAADG
jgi:hypothetical protein